MIYNIINMFNIHFINRIIFNYKKFNSLLDSKETNIEIAFCFIDII